MVKYNSTTMVQFGAIPDGTAGQVLKSNGAGVAPSFQTDATNSPGGSNTEMQFNDNGSFGAISNGTAGQILTSNGAGSTPTFQAAPASGIAAVVDDTTPELGGNLNLNGNEINGSGNIDITGNIEMSGGRFKLDGGYPVGINNVAVGQFAGNSLNSGSQSNTLIGNTAGNSIVSSDDNTAVGNSALRVGSSSNLNRNTAIGRAALEASQGGDNTGLGYQAGNLISTGFNNTVIGSNAQASSGTASNEITLGDTNVTSLRIPGLQSGASANDVLTFNGTDITLAAAPGIDTSGSAWSASGDTVFLQSTGQNSPTDYSNSIVLNSGSVKLDGNYPTGINNVAMGNGAGQGFSSGALGNTVIGNIAGQNVSTGDNNTAIGTQALRQTNLNSNTAVGSQALELNNQTQNTAVGHLAMSAGSSGQDCVAIGYRALNNNNSNFNTAVGKDALRSMGGSGVENCALGTNAGGNLASGNSNIFIGRNCGTVLTSGGNNILIGKGAQPSTDPINNEITLGDSNITTLRCQVTSITSLSDARDKKDVEDANIGLDFINDLRPVKFVWDTRDGAKKDIKEVGFIAQELDEVQQKHGIEDSLQLVLKNNPDKLEAAPGKLIPILVQAIKDLKKEIDELKKA